MDLKPIELPYKSLAGISEGQIREHYEVLYKGYVSKVNDIRRQLSEVSKEGVNGTYHNFRELKLEESFALDAVKLHEIYFLGLGGDGQPKEKIKAWLEKDFGSFESWLEQFSATGMSARGWAVTYFDFTHDRLDIALADFHSHGAIWNGSPIIVLDVYEHAYFLDYGTKRKDYLEKYFENINWDLAEKLIENVEKVTGPR